MSLICRLKKVSGNLGRKVIRMQEAGPMKETYAGAGVDISLKSKVIAKISQYARATHRPQVLSGVGFFGGLYEMKGYLIKFLRNSCFLAGTLIAISY